MALTSAYGYYLSPRDTDNNDAPGRDGYTAGGGPLPDEDVAPRWGDNLLVGAIGEEDEAGFSLTGLEGARGTPESDAPPSGRNSARRFVTLSK